LGSCANVELLSRVREMGLFHRYIGSNSNARWIIGASLLAFYLFLSLALFSSLHKHNPNAAGIQCTLNNFEHQVAEGAASVAIVFSLILIARAFLPPEERKQRYFHLFVISGRAPPVF